MVDISVILGVTGYLAFLLGVSPVSVENLPAVAEPMRARNAHDLETGRQRRELVARYKLHGYTNAQIADALGVSAQLISQDMKRIRDEWKRSMTESYDQHVATEVAAYNEMEKSISESAMAGSLDAVALKLKIRERRAKLLGLDSPTKHEVQVVSIDALDAEIARLESLLGPIRESTDEQVYDAEIVE